MTIDLLRALSKFEVANDQESEIAVFRTHVPWVAPLAYLHIIYKPAPHFLLEDLAEKLRMPKPCTQLLAKQNGAHLFAGALSIFGVHRQGQLLNREDPFLALPFNIEWENAELKCLDRARFLAIGGYGFDGSTVCIDRRDGRVSVFRRDETNPLVSWCDLEDWVNSEVARLSLLFDWRGKRLVDEIETVPKQSPAQ